MKNQRACSCGQIPTASFFIFLYLIILLIFVISQSYSCTSAFSSALWLLAPGVISHSVRLLLIGRVIYHQVLMSYPSSLWVREMVKTALWVFFFYIYTETDVSSIFEASQISVLSTVTCLILGTRQDEFPKDHKVESTYLHLFNTGLTPVSVGCFDPETNNGMCVTKALE